MSIKREKRITQLIDIINLKQKVDVSELSHLLHVSQVTIRKDLDELEKRGFVKREHGYAHINSTDNITSRLSFHYDEKMKIANQAASLIQDGDTVMIESGSCCALLASVLANTKKNITIITNSVFITEYLKEYKDTEVILLGGTYQKESQCLVGPMIRDTASNYNTQYFFIGIDGWSERTGFTNKDPLRTQAIRDMSHSSENLVVLTESSKFQYAGTIPLNIRNQPKYVITDKNLSKDIQESLRKHKTETIFAK